MGIGCRFLVLESAISEISVVLPQLYRHRLYVLVSSDISNLVMHNELLSVVVRGCMRLCCLCVLVQTLL